MTQFYLPPTHFSEFSTSAIAVPTLLGEKDANANNHTWGFGTTNWPTPLVQSIFIFRIKQVRRNSS